MGRGGGGRGKEREVHCTGYTNMCHCWGMVFWPFCLKYYGLKITKLISFSQRQGIDSACSDCDRVDQNSTEYCSAKAGKVEPAAYTH